ncbi:MAG: hypothetical protein JW915_24170 [Chitinispirillaceae bacterium]|nr:hypothetical protein [Chitinispirillaceae bacterium]
MFDLYYLPEYAESGSIFPRKLINTYKNERELIDTFEFTVDEMEDLIAGKIVRDKFVCEMPYEFLKMIRSDYILETARDNPDGMKFREIGKLLECREDTACACFSNAIKKIDKSGDGNLKKFLLSISKLREMRERNFEYGKTSH